MSGSSGNRILQNSLRGVLAFCLVIIFAPGLATGQDYTPGQKLNLDFEALAQPFLEDNCFDCHSGSSPEGDLSLQDLGPVDEANADTWQSVWAQVALREMPPPDMDAPDVIDRLKFTDWIISQLEHAMRGKGGFHAHLDPDKANFLDHKLLFGRLPEGIALRPTSTPARIWRVTPQEHITRMNELINTEPKFNPDKPGLRAHGDVVPINHGGELKLYFGIDRITDWSGGTVAYATAVKSVPAVLSSSRAHGLKNYPQFHSVNSAEAAQIMSLAEDIIDYMAYGPLSIADPSQITDDVELDSKGNPDLGPGVGDIRGLPSSLFYSTDVVRPLTPIIDLMEQDDPNDQTLRKSINYLFEAVTFRPPTKRETKKYLSIVKRSIDQLGKQKGAVLGLSSIFLDRDALFRSELAQDGQPDRFGRVMLQDWELGLAVNHALRYIKPDAELRQAIVDGKMRTREDVKREVERMLNDESIRKPRILRFFRDYFDYDLAGYICKDSAALKQTGGLVSNDVEFYRNMFESTASTDRLIEMILSQDKDVLKQLLTTDKVVAQASDKQYFGRRRSAQEISDAKSAGAESTAKEDSIFQAELDAATKEVESKKQIFDAIAQWRADYPTRKKEKRKDLKAAKRNKLDAERSLRTLKLKMKSKSYLEKYGPVEQANLKGRRVYARVSRPSFGKGSMKPERFLATVPKGQRLGLLTHPSWLVSHSDAMDNHAIRRGRWIQERLLGGGIPDVPITVDAMLPDEPHNTLRKRMRVTTEEYCWTCHKKMDPLGLPFEIYNHAGLFRTTELNKPVDASGEIIDSGDPELDGKVDGAIELIQKLAQSQRAEEVFVRHAFRFWMGRNETLNDAPVLQAAQRAYREKGGSMNALITSLLTSDAFLYRSKEDDQN